MAKSTVWQLVSGSSLAYNPRVRGTLREAVAKAADHAMHNCTTVAVYRAKRGFEEGRPIATIGKPLGCSVSKRTFGRRDYAKVIPPVFEQKLTLDTKRSTAKKLVLKWEKY